MSERKIIIGLVGPSGVGKGYCKEAIKEKFPNTFSEPVVVTTRPQRPTDGIDRKAGIHLDDFTAMNSSGGVVFVHQPLGSGSHWYGFLRESLENTKRLVLTEIHVDNIIPFKEKYGDSIKLIALIAEQEYLKRNISDRDTESAEDAQLRLEQAIREVDKINELSDNGYLDIVISVGEHNRYNLGEIVIEGVSNFS